MREILFRGKQRIGADQWIFGDLEHFGDHLLIYTRTGEHGFIHPDTVGQWTGLTDKNGVKVFEGDVVEADEVQAVVKFGRCGGVKNTEREVGYMGFYLDSLDEKCKRYGLRDDIVYWHEEYGLEVIGNIHDNPDKEG